MMVLDQGGLGSGLSWIRVVYSQDGLGSWRSRIRAWRSRIRAWRSRVRAWRSRIRARRSRIRAWWSSVCNETGWPSVSVL